MPLKDKIFEESKRFNAQFQEGKDGSLSLEIVVAERRVLFSRKRLIYKCRVDINETEKIVKFHEILKETSCGLSCGEDMGPGFGFKKEVYKTGVGGREGTLEELSILFGKKYKYSFNYSSIKDIVGQVAQKEGYKFLTFLF